MSESPKEHKAVLHSEVSRDTCDTYPPLLQLTVAVICVNKPIVYTKLTKVNLPKQQLSDAVLYILYLGEGPRTRDSSLKMLKQP